MSPEEAARAALFMQRQAVKRAGKQTRLQAVALIRGVDFSRMGGRGRRSGKKELFRGRDGGAAAGKIVPGFGRGRPISDAARLKIRQEKGQGRQARKER